jgi:hypothetical protein
VKRITFFKASKSVLLALLSLAILMSAIPASSASAPVSVPVSISSNESLQVIVPTSSNITVISLTGGPYNVGISNGARENKLVFSPNSPNSQNDTYSMLLNVSSYGSNSVMVMQSSTSGILSLVKNFTAQGNMILNLSITVTPGLQSPSSWNALSGFLGFGLNLGGVNLDTTDVLAIFAGMAILVIGLGAKFSQKFIFFGLFLLSLVGIVAIGILGIGLVFGLYITSFYAVRYYYGALQKRQARQM